MNKKSNAFISGYTSRVLKVLNKYQNPFTEGSVDHVEWLNGYNCRKLEEYKGLYP